MQFHNWSLTEIDNLLPFELDIYTSLLEEWVREENARNAEANQRNN